MENLFSSSWYSVSELKPGLRKNLEITSHKFRDEIWYIYQDIISGKSHKFSPLVHFFISLMNGKRTTHQIWDAMNTKFGDDAPTQDETIQLLSQLHMSEIIKSDVTPQIEELFQRAYRHKVTNWKKRFSNPIALRLSLIDPENLLIKLQPWFGWMFTTFFAILCVSIFVLAAAHAVTHWESISHYASQNMLSTNNLLILWLIYPLVKLVHELAHAIAVKNWGGEVHEMGVMLLYFTPIPYVDASSSTAFRSTYKRVIVSAAGIIAEMILASIAFFVWLNVEPGLVQNIAFNVMVIGGVSTILFNGNPLLRYDAYYMLSDIIGIPNLASRSNKHIGYLIVYYIFGGKDFTSPSRSFGESVWFILYGLSAFSYRMFILFFILLFITKKYFFLGMLIGCWVVISQLVIPLAKHIVFVFTDSRMKHHQLKMWSSLILISMFSYYFLFNVPMPHATVAEGVVWLDDNAQIRTNNDGFVSHFYYSEGDVVKAGDTLMVSRDPLLKSTHFSLNSKLTQLTLEYRSEWNKDRTKRKIILEQMESVKSEIERTNEVSDSLTVYSPASGTISIPNSDDLIGQFIKKGTLIGYVLDNTRISARVLINQNEMELIKETDIIHVRFAEDIQTTYQSALIEISPSATEKIPNAILGIKGGGKIAQSSKDESGLTATEKYFEIQITLPNINTQVLIGSRLYVRFSHGEQPVAERFRRWINQLLLREFNV